MTSSDITLIIAIIGAVTGSISFVWQLMDRIKYRHRLQVEFISVFDSYENDDDSDFDFIYFYIRYTNPSEKKIVVIDTPTLILRLKSNRRLRKYNLLPEYGSLMYKEIPPLDIENGVYKCPQLCEDIKSGILPDFQKFKSEALIQASVSATTGKHQTKRVPYESLEVKKQNVVDEILEDLRDQDEQDEQ